MVNGILNTSIETKVLVNVIAEERGLEYSDLPSDEEYLYHWYNDS